MYTVNWKMYSFISVFTFSIVLSHGRDHIHPADVTNRLPVLTCCEFVPRRSHARRLSRMPHAAPLTVAHAYLWPLASALGCRRAREISALASNENDMGARRARALRSHHRLDAPVLPGMRAPRRGSHPRTRVCGLPPGACAASGTSSFSWRGCSQVSRAPLAKPLVIPPDVQLVVPAHHAVASRNDGNGLTYAWATWKQAK